MEQNDENYDDENPFGDGSDQHDDQVGHEDAMVDDYDYDPGGDELDGDEASETDFDPDDNYDDESEHDSSEVDSKEKDDNYGADKIRSSISKRLSRARYHKINLELINNIQPKIRVISENMVFEIMMAALGNSFKVNRGFRDNYSTAERYSTFLTNYNLGNYKYDPSSIMFKPTLFNGINKENDNDTYLDFKATVDSAEYLEDIGIMKCLSSKMDWGVPDHILSKDASECIKKVFSIELLNEELKERISIQKRLSLLMAEYETEILACYDKLSYLKSSDTKTQEEYETDIKIGMMHSALEREGYEDIFYKRNRRGAAVQIDVEEINDLKRASVMRQKAEKEIVYVEKPIPSLFETYGSTEFKISNYDKKFVTQKLEKLRKYLEETGSEGVF